jgi:hypothetical protein
MADNGRLTAPKAWVARQPRTQPSFDTYDTGQDRTSRGWTKRRPHLGRFGAARQDGPPRNPVPPRGEGRFTRDPVLPRSERPTGRLRVRISRASALVLHLLRHTARANLTRRCKKNAGLRSRIDRKAVGRPLHDGGGPPRHAARGRPCMRRAQPQADPDRIDRGDGGLEGARFTIHPKARGLAG